MIQPRYENVYHHPEKNNAKFWRMKGQLQKKMKPSESNNNKAIEWEST